MASRTLMIPGLLVRRVPGRRPNGPFQGEGEVGVVLEDIGDEYVLVNWPTVPRWYSLRHTLEVLSTPEGVVWALGS